MLALVWIQSVYVCMLDISGKECEISGMYFLEGEERERKENEASSQKTRWFEQEIIKNIVIQRERWYLLDYIFNSLRNRSSSLHSPLHSCPFRANAKSIMRMSPEEDTTIFLGSKSLCTTPFTWIARTWFHNTSF